VPVTQPETSLSERMLTFSKPFKQELWGLLVAIAVLTGCVIWWFETSGMHVEAGAEPEMNRSVPGCLKSLWFSGLAFTGQGGYTAVTVWGRIAVLSFSFLILISVSSYTANLASFLIIKPGSMVKLIGWEDATSQRAKICASIGTANGDFLEGYAGGQLQIVDTRGLEFEKIRDMLLQQNCNGWAVTTNKWERMQRTEAFNKGCKFQTVGDVVKPGHSGAPMSVFGECQYMVVQGVSLALKQLADQDRLEELRLKAIRKTATMTESCLPGGSKGKKVIGQLGIQEMMGIIIIHVACLTISLVGFVVFKVIRQVRPAPSHSDVKDAAQSDTAPSDCAPRSDLKGPAQPDVAAAPDYELVAQIRAVVAEELQKVGRESRVGCAELSRGEFTNV